MWFVPITITSCNILHHHEATFTRNPRCPLPLYWYPNTALRTKIYPQCPLRLTHTCVASQKYLTSSWLFFKRFLMFYFQFSWQIKYQNCFKNKDRKTSDSVIFQTRFRSTMHVHVAYVNKMGCAFLRFIVDQDLGKTEDALDNIYMYVIVTWYLTPF